MWGLTGGDIPLNPGETRVLTLATARPGDDFTNLPPYLAGATVYVLVDSINLATTYGAVQELNEANNLAQSTSTAASSTSQPALPATTSQALPLDELPTRPSVP